MTNSAIIRRKFKGNNIRDFHDDFADARVLKPGRARRTVKWLLEGLTVESGEPVPSAVSSYTPNTRAHEDGDIHQTAWFKVHNVGHGRMRVGMGKWQAAEHDFADKPYSRSYSDYGAHVTDALDNFVAAYKGSSLGSLTELDSAVQTQTSSVDSYTGLSFRVEEDNTNIYIQAGCLVPRTTGEAYVYYDCAPPPANDLPDFQDAGGVPINLGPAGSGSGTFDGCLYFDNPGVEVPTSCGTVHKAAWYSWTAPTSVDVTLTATSPAGQCLMAAYKDDGTFVACGADTATFTPVAGQAYRFAFGFVANNVCGTVSFRWSQTGVFNGIYYVGFDFSINATGANYSTNGNVTFPPDLIEMLALGPFDYEGQTLGIIRNAAPATDYSWIIGFDNRPGLNRFGPNVVAGHVYHVDVKFTGIDTIDVTIDGVEYGPFDYTGTFEGEGFTNPWYTRFILGGGPFDGTLNTYKGIFTLDNVTLGTTGYGSTDLLTTDFSSLTAVPPFDVVVDTGGEASFASGAMVVNYPGGGSSKDAYAQKDTGF